jgi:parallel beta-helix repeat protein
MRKRLGLSLAIVCFALSAVRADEARIPIFQPLTITAAGHYILTRDLAPTSGDAITIMTDNVTLDLNGRTIQSAPASSAIVVGGFHGIVVRNGRLQGGQLGILGYASSAGTTVGLRVEGVEARGAAVDGIQVTSAGIVEVISCRLTDMGQSGIIINSPAGATFGGRIVDNVVNNVGSGGIVLQTPRALEVRRNLVTLFGTTSTATTGLVFGGSETGGGGNIVEGNTVRGSGNNFGISIAKGADNLVANNVISAVGYSGLGISTPGNRIVGNVVSSCGVGGIYLNSGADRNTIERNHLEGNTGDGITILSDYNLVDSNVSEGNGGYGFKVVGTGNAYRNNMLRNNVSGTVAGTATDAGGNVL